LWLNNPLGLQPASNSIQNDSRASRALKGCPLLWQSSSISPFTKELWTARERRVLALLSHATQEASSISKAFLLCSFSYTVSRENTEEDGETPVPCRITDIDVIIFS